MGGKRIAGYGGGMIGQEGSGHVYVSYIRMCVEYIYIYVRMVCARICRDAYIQQRDGGDTGWIW